MFEKIVKNDSERTVELCCLIGLISCTFAVQMGTNSCDVSRVAQRELYC